MSKSLNIYIGAGIKIPIQKEKYISKQITCCSHTYCSFMYNKFCPECGKELTFIEVEKERTVSIDTLTDSENLIGCFEDDYTYIFSNFGHGLIKVKVDKPIKINTELIDAKIAEFKVKHEEDIVILEKRIGFSVNVEFFFLYYYS